MLNNQKEVQNRASS